MGWPKRLHIVINWLQCDWRGQSEKSCTRGGSEVNARDRQRERARLKWLLLVPRDRRSWISAITQDDLSLKERANHLPPRTPIRYERPLSSRFSTKTKTEHI